MADMTKREKLVQIIADSEDLDSAVDAILAELREPDDKMYKAAHASRGKGNWHVDYQYIWQAMVDAIK